MLWAAAVAVAALTGLATACPGGCRCSLDGRGRQQVSCMEGGMRDPIPVQQMPSDTQVLLIAAPATKPNGLSLGPIFRKLPNLEEIHIIGSGVPALGAHSFWGLRKLKVLNLTRNALSALMDTNFKGADFLRHLDLSHNRINSIPSAEFRYVSHIRTLDLSYNQVPELVPRIFFGLTRLERLSLSHNPLRDLQPERFSDVPNLRHFSCASCSLTSISKTLLLSLTKLKDLDLRNNQLATVPANLSLLPNLLVIHLDGNHISFLERGLIAGAPLTHLTLSHNRIIRIESGALFNCSLTHLDISYNRLSHLEPGALDDALGHLHSLQLSGNSLHIDQLLSVLPKALKLRALGVGDMGLDQFPLELLHHTKHLHHLNISANNLIHLSPSILSTAINLHILDLSLNSFRGLQEDLVVALKGAKKLLQLRLEGNPWQCDACHMTAMLEWLHSAPDQRSGCEDPLVWSCLTCVGPRQVSGMQISLLPPGDLPICLTTTSVAPTWETTVATTIVSSSGPYPEVFASYEPTRLPSGQRRGPASSTQWTFGELFHEQLHYFVVAACSLFLILLAIIIIAIVLYNRKSAYYYTHETDPEKREKLMRTREAKNNNSPSTSPPKPKVDLKDDTVIPTIEEMTEINGTQEIVEEDRPPRVEGEMKVDLCPTNIELTTAEQEPDIGDN
ncbi:uncharacterized protein LOC143029197 [Oratosquilla oratoria]|uniref:uncharacterized protein LOC143029197 n=1 Tax=Oratosquilla oratoria TaxID=337810 RepID=UPI003F77601F